MNDNAAVAPHTAGTDESNCDSGVIWCPTCKAEQRLTGECRRCHCDLSLLESLRAEVSQLRGQCMDLLENRCYFEASQLARVICDAAPDPQNRELAALCLLLAGDYAEARTFMPEGGLDDNSEESPRAET